MQEPPDDIPISSFEDLDPEPDDERGLAGRREFILGVVLLVAVLAWSAYQWVDTQRQSGEYRLAEQAVDRHDWDAAYARFSGIKGFKDASARAAQAAGEVHDRDTGYEKAREAAGRGDWITALQAARAVMLIQPGYFNAAQIADQAQQELTDQALGGAVALRTDASLPGLYYRTGGSWTWLRGSDESSRVRGLGSADHVVYDVPAAQSPNSPQTPTGYMDGRALVLASLDGAQISYQSLAFDPSEYSFYVWGERGAWALRYDYGDTAPSRYGLRSDYTGYLVDYQAYSSPITQPLRLEFPRLALLDLAPKGDGVLLSATSYSAQAWRTELYAANGDGSNPRLLYAGTGGIREAHFSPDGRYVLLSWFNPTNNYRIEQESVLLIDTARPGAVTELTTRQTGADTGKLFPSVGATFLNRGPLAGYLLLFEWNPGNRAYAMPEPSSVFTLLDPAHPDTPVVRAEADSYPIGPAWVSEDPRSKGLLIAWQDGLGDALRYADTIMAMRMVVGQDTVVRRIQLNRNVIVQGAWLRGDYLVFSDRALGVGSQPGRLLSVSALRLDGDTPRRPKATLLYTNSLPPNDSFDYSELWAAGPELFAYTDGGQLRARTLTGDADVHLESGIESLYSFPYSELHWLR